MRVSTHLWLLIGLLGQVATPALAAPIMHESGWTISTFATVPVGAQDAEVDGGGNLYVACGESGVFRLTPDGSSSLWSSAQGVGLTMLPTGEAYLPSRDIFATKYLWQIQPNGTYSQLVGATSPSWYYAAIAPTGTLYANVIGAGKGIYLIDRQTGAATPFLMGGPGPGGIGSYLDMTTTSDGTLYVCGTFAPGNGIFRVTSGASSLVVPVTTGMWGICRGPSDVLFGTTYTGSGPATDGQVWKLDVASGTETLFASGFGETIGIAYDPTNNRFYLVQPGGQIWVIVNTQTPVQVRSWGSMKSLYR